MKVRLSSNIPLGREDIELAGQDVTLRNLLERLAEGGTGLPRLIDPRTGRVSHAFAVSVNRKQYEALPGGLDTRLKDNDSVEIALAMFAGG
jgi:hypothetical protein